MEYGYVELGWNVLKLWQTPRSNDRYWFAWVTGCVPDDPSPDLLSLLFANFLPSLLFLRNRFSVESTLRKLPWVNTHTHLYPKSAMPLIEAPINPITPEILIPEVLAAR